MNITQKIIETHKLKFRNLPPLQQCRVSGSALFNADCMDILPLIPDEFEHDLAEEHVIDFVNNQLQGIEAINYSTFKEKTGYDCTLWLCDYISEQHEQGNNIKLNDVELKPKTNEVKDKEIE